MIYKHALARYETSETSMPENTNDPNVSPRAAYSHFRGTRFRRLKLDLDPEIALASFCYRLKTMPSVGAHPDEKLAVSPGKQVHWDQTKSRLRNLEKAL